MPGDNAVVIFAGDRRLAGKTGNIHHSIGKHIPGLIRHIVGQSANPQWRKLPCLPIATASYVLAETPPEIISASGESSKPPGRDTMPTRSSASTYTLLSAPATSVKNRELWYRRYKAASASVSSPSDGRSREANNRFFHTGSGGLNYPFP